MTSLGIGIRLWLWAAMVRVLKRIVPLNTLVRLTRQDPKAESLKPEAVSRTPTALEQRLASYLARRGRFPFRPPSNCLERSLGAYRLLCGVAADPQLVIGVRRSEERGVEGHVWVAVGGRVLAETPEDLATFTTIVTFDANARQRTAAGFEGAWSEMRLP